MAVRTPLKLDGSNNLIEMNATDIANIKAQCLYLYGLSPSVDMNVVASGGSLGTINDTRLQAGAYAGSITSYPVETTTAEPSVVTVAYSRLNSTVETTTQPADTSSLAFPLYQSAGNIYAMTATDMYDTFITPAIATLADGTDRPGTYRIHTASTLADHTLVSTTTAFDDTRANTSLYAAANIPATLDQPTTITNFYLFITNAGTATSYSLPIFARAADGDIQQYTSAAFDTMLQNFMRHAASAVVGSRVRYTINGAGVNRGSAMTDTRLNGSGNYQIRFVSVDDYRAQEFPNGTAVTISTYSLKIGLS